METEPKKERIINDEELGKRDRFTALRVEMIEMLERQSLAVQMFKKFEEIGARPGFPEDDFFHRVSETERALYEHPDVKLYSHLFINLVPPSEEEAMQWRSEEEKSRLK